MSKRRIKKYVNRRLYDTEASRYVTVEDIRQLIVKGIDVEVIDEAKNEDITRALMLQIISEQEFSGRPILSEYVLAQLIRFYGHPLQSYMSAYLSSSVDMFVKQQQSMQSQFKQFVSSGPIDTMQSFTNKNMEMWSDFQKSFFANASKEAEDDKE
jgi:polyhydroxyalkanoate synthesis repressor PhaR